VEPSLGLRVAFAAVPARLHFTEFDEANALFATDPMSDRMA
jgi:hypothetical protein